MGFHGFRAILNPEGKTFLKKYIFILWGVQPNQDEEDKEFVTCDTVLIKSNQIKPKKRMRGNLGFSKNLVEIGEWGS